PQGIKAHHLARKAVIYVRQSTGEQVRTNIGSTEYQRDQIRYALAWGWPPDRIETIETDLGLTGSAAGHRAGYQSLLQEIELGDVGASFMSDTARVGRDALEWFHFIERCRVYQVLIVVDGRIYDPNTRADRLTLQLLATVAEDDNFSRRDVLMNGRL